MLVQRGDSIYAQAPHDSEAGSVHDREILIFPSDATSKSAAPTVSIIAIPPRNPSQNRSAAVGPILWCSKVQVSTRMWSEITIASPEVRIALARELLRSEESAAAYQMEVSTKRLPGERSAGALAG